MQRDFLETIARTERTAPAVATLSTPGGRVKITQRLKDALTERRLVHMLNSTLYPSAGKSVPLVEFLTAHTNKLAIGDLAKYERLDLAN